MADRKKMTVAEMLAAARKADAGGGTPAAGGEPAVEPAAPESAPVETARTGAAEAVPAGPVKPAVKPGGARPSVAEMMAMARAKKAGEAPAEAAAESAAPAAPKAKPTAAAKSGPAKAVPAGSAGPRDTASILGAARKKDQPGPMSKAEAAAKLDKGAAAALAKPKIVAPPMPTKPAYAQPKVAVTPKAAAAVEGRRDFFGTALAVGFWALGAVSALWTLLTLDFMFPNVLREPPSKFKVGFPDAFPPGQVEEKYKAQYAIWVVNAEYNGQQQIVALKSVCTHLGCTPNWLEAEQKFKCPCHGSGFYKDGINFEGPAPRPLERYAIRLADDGQIEVDKTRTFQEEMGAWSDASSFIPV